MITKIEVDGFKSLSDFELKLNKGVNILVGPNGAGKTNIILFFEFLAQIGKNPIARAVSLVGGAGSIFKKMGKESYQDYVKFKIFGSTRLGAKYIVYEYEAEVKISFEKDSIFFSKQITKIRNASKFWDDPDVKSYKSNWDIHVEYNYDGESKETLEMHKLSKKLVGHMYFISEEKLKDKESTSQRVEGFILSQGPSTRPILNGLYPFLDITHGIMQDLAGGETFNIVPSKVKELEDAATPPEIKRDGSGLATTLYAMSKKRTSGQEARRIFFGHDRPERSFAPKTLEKVKSYLRLANNTISDLTIENDPFDNKLLVKISIKTGSYESILPLSAMSDGTIKWLSLTTAILTSQTIFSIEEPENFLHPWMQSEIAQIMRDHISEKKSESFVLMTTHSESLLNSSNPEEIIIVDLQEGRTIARRIKDVNLIKEEISKSGFGLGHFYISNSFPYA